jgi:hypothetical protein
MDPGKSLERSLFLLVLSIGILGDSAGMWSTFAARTDEERRYGGQPSPASGSPTVARARVRRRRLVGRAGIVPVGERSEATCLNPGRTDHAERKRGVVGRAGIEPATT